MAKVPRGLISVATLRAALLLGAVSTLTLATTSCSGDGREGSCPDIDSCGGNPTGTWKIQDVCEFGIPEQPTFASEMAPGYSTPQTPGQAHLPPPKYTAGDWCSGLIYLTPSAAGTTGAVASIKFSSPPLTFEQGTVAFLADQSYSIITTVSSPATTHFTPACLQAYGANPTCKELTDGLLAVPNPNYNDVGCFDASDGGCDCKYNIEGTGSDTGTWGVEGNILYEYSPVSGRPPQQVKFCQKGDTMTIGGSDGEHLSGSAGLRTMYLKRVTTDSPM